LLASVTLLFAIWVGNGMGSRVLGQITSRPPDLSITPMPLPSPTSADAASEVGWKRTQVLSVATDPAFPDPRVTPEPPVVATPRPTPTAKPTPSPSPRSAAPYTSPPLPIPLASHDPDETSPPDAEPSASASPQPSARF
jgi:hypothetical protein